MVPLYLVTIYNFFVSMKKLQSICKKIKFIFAYIRSKTYVTYVKFNFEHILFYNVFSKLGLTSELVLIFVPLKLGIVL